VTYFTHPPEMLRILALAILLLIEHSCPFPLLNKFRNTRIRRVSSPTSVDHYSRGYDSYHLYHRYQPPHATILYSSFRLTATTDSNEQENTQLSPEQDDFFASLDPELYGGAFIERLRDLQGYKNNHGSCIVPKRYDANPTLGNWVNKMRQMYRKFKNGEKSSITQIRVDILDDMGFLWVAGGLAGSDGQLVTNNEQLWMQKYGELKAHILQDDGTNLSSCKSLYPWVVRQRKEHMNYEMGEQTLLTEEQLKLLDSIGFVWSPYETKWNMRIKQLKEYKNKFGDCLVSFSSFLCGLIMRDVECFGMLPTHVLCLRLTYVHSYLLLEGPNKLQGK